MSRKVLGGSPGPPCPPNWTRTINQGKTVYTTPLGHEIYNLTQLRDFLLSDVTCKCNLPCPLIVDQWFDFSSGNKRGLDEASISANRRREGNPKKLKQSKRPYDALLMERLLGKVDDASRSNEREVFCTSPTVSSLPACDSPLGSPPSSSVTQNGKTECMPPPSSVQLCSNNQQASPQQPLHQSVPQQQQQQQQQQVEFSNNQTEHLVNENDVARMNKQQPLFVTTVETPHLYQQPLQVYCSPSAARPIILNSSGSVQNSMLSPQQPEIILNGTTGQLSTVDLNTVNNISNAQGLLSTTQLFPYPHVIDSISPASIVLGVSMGSSVSMGIMGIDSSQLQQIPTLATAPSRELNQSQGGSTLVMSPYTMAPMSLEGISCGVLQTPSSALESSQAALTNPAATVITAQAAARAANGATILSPPVVPSVCHILPISPIMNADNAATRDSNENALLFNVSLDENSLLLQSQECDVIE